MHRPSPLSPVLTCGLALLLATAIPARAIQITAYTSTTNDRFSSGYPSAPVENTSTSFVGYGYDLSGVGWNASNATQSFALLSPGNYLVARHYGGASTINFLGGDGSLDSYTQSSVQDTGYGVVFSGQTLGDISIGTLTNAIDTDSTQITPYAVFDASSTQIFLYGRGPNGSTSTRLASTTINGSNTTATNTSLIVTPLTDAQYESGDSGSPAFIAWTDPTGKTELTVVGNAAGVSSSNNYLNFLNRQEAVDATNAIMEQTGYALRWVANATTTWNGGAHSGATKFGTGSNWSTGVTPNSSSYIALSSTSTSYTTLDLSGLTQSAKGLIFYPGSTGFTVQNGTLNLGRGGLNNYDIHAQALSNSFILTEDQYWDGRSGGFTVTGGINTNGKLLIVQGTANSSISGAISGTGSLAKDGAGILSLTGTNTYTGTTFIHNGTVQIGGGNALPDAGLIRFDNIKNALLDVNGSTETIGALQGGGTTGGNVALHGGNLIIAGSTAGTFSGSTSLDSGTLTVGGGNTQTFAGAISGNGSLIKNGSGMLILNWTSGNSYTGQTTVNAGILQVASTAGSATGSSSITVNGGTLIGNGIVSGSTIIAAGARLSAGLVSSGSIPTLNTTTQSQNTLTLGNDLTLNGTFSFYLGALSESVGFTQLALSSSSSTLQLGNSSSFTLSSTSFRGIGDPNSGASFWNASHSWTLVDVAGSNSIAGAFGTTDLGTWTQGVFSVSYSGGTGNDVSLIYTAAVPEPSEAIFTALGMVTLLGGYRFRRSRK